MGAECFVNKTSLRCIGLHVHARGRPTQSPMSLLLPSGDYSMHHCSESAISISPAVQLLWCVIHIALRIGLLYAGLHVNRVWNYGVNIDGNRTRQDYRIGTAWKMSVDIDATPDLLLLIQQKLSTVQYWYGSLSPDDSRSNQFANSTFLRTANFKLHNL